MVGNSKQPTRSEKKRMGQIKEIGCIACLLKNWPDSHCEIHHVVEGRVRLGHMQTIGFCLWHHRGETSNGMSKQQMGGMLGPSLAHGSRYFAEEFGSQATLVAVQDYLIEKYETVGWLSYSIPRDIILDTFYKWSELRQADGTL